MKKKAKNHVLHFPLEFLIACTIYKLDPAEVLQKFISHVTVYDSMAKGYSSGYSEASKTIALYINSLKRAARSSHAYSHCLESTVLNFKNIHDLAHQQTGPSKAKRQKSLTFVNDLYDSMERVYTSSDTFHIDENTMLHFSKDFTVMCELHNCYPVEYLENFMSKISLAEMEAKSGLKIPNENFTMFFFMKIILGWGVNNKMPDLNDGELAFAKEMAELRVSIFTIRTLKQRIAVFTQFFHKRYQEIIQQN